MKKIKPILFHLLLFVFFNAFCDATADQNPTRGNPLIIKKDSREILIAGYVQTEKYNSTPLFSFGHTKNWHAIVWEGGTTKKSDILFVSYADDLSVYKALVQIGGMPGNNLTTETWEKRGERNHIEPNKKVEGTPMEISISWEGAPRPYKLSELIHDPGKKGFSFKFGGNKALIPVWKSGCIVCLYSCPGGKISNASYTANDYVFKTTHFKAKKNLLPSDGTKVIITISIL